ncbi:uncharacterized protein LOC136028712 isoform X1 [Artemia franciscana]|uniref:Uncharacterized protein n=1 Tax=Artemia franciscana TaxID=6661 RepID=A0AA88KU65_ARTSF|nr:hypothetical protein QYM36_014979 [Artemia franciscana]KAK2707145.1 hypothetical protein QYM36_014979 [Artemia franciscana]
MARLLVIFTFVNCLFGILLASPISFEDIGNNPDADSEGFPDSLPCSKDCIEDGRAEEDCTSCPDSEKVGASIEVLNIASDDDEDDENTTEKQTSCLGDSCPIKDMMEETQDGNQQESLDLEDQTRDISDEVSNVSYDQNGRTIEEDSTTSSQEEDEEYDADADDDEDFIDLNDFLKEAAVKAEPGFGAERTEDPEMLDLKDDGNKMAEFADEEIKSAPLKTEADTTTQNDADINTSNKSASPRLLHIENGAFDSGNWVPIETSKGINKTNEVALKRHQHTSDIEMINTEVNSTTSDDEESEFGIHLVSPSVNDDENEDSTQETMLPFFPLFGTPILNTVVESLQRLQNQVQSLWNNYGSFNTTALEALPNDFKNTTSMSKMVNGSLVQVNETVNKEIINGVPHLFHVKVMALVPQQTETSNSQPEEPDVQSEMALNETSEVPE